MGFPNIKRSLSVKQTNEEARKREHKDTLAYSTYEDTPSTHTHDLRKLRTLLE